MKKTPTTLLIAFAITYLSAVAVSSAQILYQDQMNSGTGWSENASTNNSYMATYNYDYSTDSIPEAPNSQSGDDATRGLKMESNTASNLPTWFTAYPTGQNFTGSHQLRFDAWMSFGTSGTTEYLGGGIGYNGTSADTVSGAQAIANGDGGSSNDWRLFQNGTYTGLGNGNAAPYVGFLPTTNGSAAGSPGFQWVTWEFNVVGNDVSIFIEKPNASRLQIASFDKTVSAATTDGNISIYYTDYFNSQGLPVADTFGLVDNVVVNAVPEPAAGMLLLLGALVGFGRLRR